MPFLLGLILRLKFEATKKPCHVFRFKSHTYALVFSAFSSLFTCNLTILRKDPTMNIDDIQRDRFAAFFMQNSWATLLIASYLIGLWYTVTYNTSFVYDSQLPNYQEFSVFIWSTVISFVLSIVFVIRWDNTIGFLLQKCDLYCPSPFQSLGRDLLRR